MAFRQPTYHAPQRVYTSTVAEEAQAQGQTQQPSQNLADEQEWILFSPVAESSTDRTYTTSTARTQTAGRSRISDFGSLDTAARSYRYYDDEDEDAAVETEDGEEDGELDSLDSHLHEFRAEPSVYGEGGETSRTVLPTHDGLGSFRVDQEGMGDEVQQHLFAFERYNPRRIKRRRESLELGMLELENDRAAEAERTRRIEKWRIEQSRALVDEIQKETRRRKQSMSSERRTLPEDQEQENVATLSNVDSENEVPSTENESLWNRITRRVIHDLMGIDDDLLSIIFGETLPTDDDLSTTPPAGRRLEIPNGLIATNQFDASCWEYRLLERIARELGLLVNQLSDHPGAFSTYINTQELYLPYAGLPVIPETLHKTQSSLLEPEESTASLATPVFHPTIPTQTEAQPLAIPQPSISLAALDTDSTPRATAPLSREEWERDLDIKMVFRYLRSRFTSKFSTSTPASTSSNASALPFATHGTAHLATASTADTAARAARVREHHPLVTRDRERERKERRKNVEKRTWKVSVPAQSSQSGMVTGLGMRRGSSSYASGKRNSGSSRHYWDFGGSVGSGSMVVSVGGMGSWGEV